MLFHPIIKAVIYYDMKTNLLTKKIKRRRSHFFTLVAMHKSAAATGVLCANACSCAYIESATQ